MSDSTIDAVPDEPVNFTKTPSANSAGAGKTNPRKAAAAQVAALPTGPAPTLPRTMQLAIGAIILQIVAGAVRAISMRGDTAKFEQWLFDTNKKAKKPKSPYSLDPTNTKGYAALTHDLHTVRSSALLQAVVIGIALVLLLFVLRRVRSAGMGRIALIVITVLTEGPFYVIPTHGWPAVPEAFSVIYGLASILTLILLLMPQSNEYFRACKRISTPEGATPRPGLGALFGGARNAGAGTRGAVGARATRPPRNAATRPAAAPATGGTPVRGSQKAKAREAAVAKGAELARTRAKAASKSRKTEA